MWKKFLIQLGFFLFELGIGIFARSVLGKDGTNRLTNFVEELETEDYAGLTGKQKYNRVKKLVDEIAGDIPDNAKNMVIEASVAKLKKEGGGLLERVVNKNLKR